MWSTCGLQWAADSANTEQWQCCCLSSSYICGHVACDWLAACSTHDLQTFYSVLIEPDSKFIGSRTWREEPRTQTILHQRWTRHQRELSILLLHCAQIPLCVLVPQILSILCPSHDCTACWKDYTDKTVEKAKTYKLVDLALYSVERAMNLYSTFLPYSHLFAACMYCRS